MELGYEKGDKCGRNDCEGILMEHDTEGSCSCHINPPCSYCTDSRVFCPVCGWDGREDQIKESKVYRQSKNEDYGFLKQRTMADLDRSKIDYLNLMHTHFSMIKKGVFPKGTTREEVEKVVIGTFGGRFTHFDTTTCEFSYVSYTD